MKILKIRFANLNSLVGNWEIDLTDQVFLQNGIFAISGPTGAGKSTILDAISLALYGRTPRLNKITKTSNEIMSRQTGECFAEVTFETLKGVFRCHWSQRRARKKPNGELQAPKQEISDAVTGKILETKLRDISNQIESITGMDFDQFTRSMLLAQGGFAAFLEADADQRAPILEQITGTDIYSKISVRVHEIRSEKQKELDRLVSELSGLQLLSDEEISNLQLSLEQKHLEEKEISEQIKSKNTAITWLDTIAALEKDLDTFHKQKLDLDNQIEMFKPHQAKLQLAQKALELSGELAELNLLRKTQKTDIEIHSQMAASVPDCQNREQIAKGELSNAASLLENSKTRLKEELKVIEKVRELDLKISEKNNPVKSLKDSLDSQEKFLTELKQKKQSNSNLINEYNESLKKIRVQILNSASDEILVENLAGIQTRFDHFIEFNNQYKKIQEKLSETEKQKCKNIEIWQTKKECLEQKQIEIQKIKQELENKQQQRKKLLEEKEISYWRETLSEYSERKVTFQTLCQSATEIVKLKNLLEELNENSHKLSEQKTALSEQVNNENEKLRLLESQKQLLETNFHLLNRIMSFEEARKKLTHGEQCPLCGSREHPFAQENIPSPDKTETELNETNSSIKKTAAKISSLIVDQINISKDLDQTNKQIIECTNNIEKQQTQIIELCRILKIEPDTAYSESDLSLLTEKNESKLKQILGIVELSGKYEKEIETIRDNREKELEKLSEIEHESSDAFHEKELSVQKLDQLNRELSDLKDNEEKIRGQLLSEISPLGISEIPVEKIGLIRNELISRRNARLDIQKKQTDFQNRISTLSLQVAHQEEQIQATVTESEQAKQKLQVLEQERTALIDERKSIYGIKSTTKEQSFLEKAVTANETSYENARTVYTNITSELEKQNTSVRNLEKTISERKIQLDKKEKLFCESLRRANFTDERSYIEACLPENDRKILADKARFLEVQHTTLQTRIRDKSQLLEQEQQKQITTEPQSKLKTELDTLTAQINKIQQEIGGISQKLTDNNTMRIRQEDKIRNIETQKKQCSKWNSLHELIGSADGKKYRNFAQGLTFEIMVKYANQQLGKMTDRYILVRDKSEPLELNVLDMYQ
ncbi:MAG: AAA family ATPase, partial [Fibrobacter sp.]|nr:AAA family ATPase [Fibrobacter sp.]